jgi:hypothetical protein
MPRICRAILHGDRVEWIDTAPKSPGAVRVSITLLEEVAPKSSRQHGQVMAEALATLAAKGTFSAITDPVAWQRAERQKRANGLLCHTSYLSADKVTSRFWSEPA